MRAVKKILAGALLMSAAVSGVAHAEGTWSGNIALTTAKPTDRVEGGINGTFGNYSRLRFEGFYNQPISDGLARVIVRRETEDDLLALDVG